MGDPALNCRAISQVLLGGVVVSVLFLLGCKGKELHQLEEELRKRRPTGTILESEVQYTPPFAPLPWDLTNRGIIRIAAPWGYLDKFQEVRVIDIDISSSKTPLYYKTHDAKYMKIERTRYRKRSDGDYETFGKGDYVRLDNSDYVKLEEFLYVYTLSPEIVLFEEHYGIEVEIAHIDRGEPVFSILKARGMAPAGFDLIFASRYLTEPLHSKIGIQKLDRDNIPRLAALENEMEERFPALPEDPDLQYCVPYFWSAMGIFYRSDRVVTPPKDWVDFYTFERFRELWGRVSYINHPSMTLGMALIFLRSLDDDSRKKILSNLDDLMALAEDAAGHSNPSRRIVDLNLLTKSFVTRQYGDSGFEQFGIHHENFSTSGSNAFSDITLRAQMSSPVTEVKRTDLMTGLLDETRLKQVSLMTKKALLFGANFREYGEVESLIAGDTYVTIGNAAEFFQGWWKNNRNLHFVIPESGSFVSVITFVIPDGVPKSRKRRAEFFLNYMLSPECLAGMTEFTFMANASEKARPFLSRAIANSPIYSFPPMEAIFYLPIAESTNTAVNRHWEDVRDFNDRLHEIGWEPGSWKRGAE
jgi:spermidine/putrescine-binding protein